MDEQDGYVKVHVTFANHGEEDGPPVAGEWIWAKPTDVPDQFTLENVPFFADFGLGDEVVVEPVEWNGQRIDHEVMGVVKPSGNLTGRLFFNDALTAHQRRQIAETIQAHEGCTSEWANDHLLAVSISPKHTAPDVLWTYVISGVAICDLFGYDEQGALLQ